MKHRHNTFRRLFYQATSLLILLCVSSLSHAVTLLTFPYDSPVTVCEFEEVQRAIPNFDEKGCVEKRLNEVNPQNTYLWVSLKFDRSQKWPKLNPPYALYVFGKASSKVHLNGKFLGNNGIPTADASEQPGKMDTVFHVPDDLIRDTGNQLILELSGQHSVIDLGFPMHLIGFSQFADPKEFIQVLSLVGIGLFGAFVFGGLFFVRLGFGRFQAGTYRLFAFLCFIAAVQLVAELLRGLYSYPYPWHDYRLLIVTGLSALFGITVLFYIARLLSSKKALHWIYGGSILTIIAIVFAKGYDAKTTAGIFIPMIVSLVLVFVEWMKRKDRKLLQWFIVQLAVVMTIYLTASAFHEIVYFMVIGVFLLFLFNQQANVFKLQQEQLLQEQSHIAKLEFRLSQTDKNRAPTKLEITSAGKSEFINANDVSFCKAAGDYVELHLTDGKEKLYSGSLKQLEELLPPEFLRVHRSYLVNLNDVTSLASKSVSDNSALLDLSTGKQVPVSRRLLPSVRESIKQAVL